MRRQLFRAYSGRAARKALQPLGLLDISVVYRKDLSLPVPEFRARIGVDVIEAADADLAQLQKLTGSPYHAPDLLRARMATGSKCLLARIDGEIAGFNWLALGRIHDEFYRVALHASDAYCMDAHTIEQYRGHGIHTELLYRLLTLAKTLGFRHAFTRVSAMNIASWKSHLRLGWQEAGVSYGFIPRSGRPFTAVAGPSIYPLTPCPRGGAR